MGKLKRNIKSINETFLYLLKKKTGLTLIFLAFIILLILLSVKSFSCNREGVSLNMRDKLPVVK